MQKIIRVLHILAVCVFVGSIPGHIVLGELAKSAQGNEAFAVYQQAKYALTIGLTTGGIAFTLLTGVLLGLSEKGVFKERWLRAKLLLVAMIVINGAVILTPLAEQMKDMAEATISSGVLSSDFHDAESKEAIAGAINLLLIVIVIFLAVLKPKLGSKSSEA